MRLPRTKEIVVEQNWLKNSVVEFVGTFALIFVGAGSIIATGGQNLVAIALAHGLAIGLMVAGPGHISGGGDNPSLTAGVMVTRGIGVGPGVYYVGAQRVGPIIGACRGAVVWNQFSLSDAPTSLPHETSTETEQSETAPTPARRAA